MSPRVDDAAIATRWRAVCPLDRLPMDRGVAALVGSSQLALFHLPDLQRIFVLGNVDPFSGVGCLSRGIVGDVAGEPMVVSPLHKQRFSLASGRCLEDPSTGVAVYDVRVTDGVVEVLVP
jgi:nitrite reductase (NADH) small subunit